MSERTIKNGLWAVIVFLLALPTLQRTTRLVRMAPLKGAYEIKARPAWTLLGLLSGDFQKAFDPYLEQNAGFRPWLVRLKNQMDFSLLRTTSTWQVVVGKRDYLFERNYILEYTGRSFIGESRSEERLAKLRIIRDELKKKGVDLLVAIAPGKASFYPEYIPDLYLQEPPGMSNYRYWIEKAKEKGIPLVDLNSFLCGLKATADWPLYPKGGIHWSVYGMALCVQKLVTTIEKLRRIEMVDFGWDGVEVQEEPWEIDDDINRSLNLIRRIPTEPGAYPRIHFRTKPSTVKPDVLAVADSFYQTMYGTGVSGGLFGRNDYWYYYQQAYDGQGGPRKVVDLDRKAELERHDVVLLLSTEANLSSFPFGFIEDAYRIFFPTTQEGAVALLKRMMNLDATWRKDLEERAARTGESLNVLAEKEVQTALRDDTPDVLNEAEIKTMTDSLRGDPYWLDFERRRAVVRSLDLEAQLRQDVVWLIRNRNKPFVQKYWPIPW